MRDNNPTINNRLTKSEIHRLVSKWIGVESGYLGEFSYASHNDFWLDTCGIDVDTHAFPGTTRECFIATLFDAPAESQAAALREILERYPPLEDQDPNHSGFRSPELHAKVLSWITRLETGKEAVSVSIESSTEVVQRALGDAEVLIRTQGPQSAVDRVHTAMHGYLLNLCDQADIEYQERPNANQLLKLLLSRHPSFSSVGERPQDITQILRGLAQIVDATNPIRNNSTVAHPTRNLIGPDEAWLVINAVRTMLSYFESKRQSSG